MIYSTSTHYAIRGLSELAARAANPADRHPGLMMVEHIATATSLPKEFLAKVFQQLARAGILASVRGRGGGFILARPAHEIRLSQIVDAVEGTDAFDRCVVGLDRCNDHAVCPEHDLFKPIRQRLKDYLNSTTLADLVSGLKCKPGWNGSVQQPKTGSDAFKPSDTKRQES